MSDKKILEKQSDIFSFILEEANDGWWDWQLREESINTSEKFWKTFGIETQEKKHHSSDWQKLIHPDDLKSTIDYLHKYSRKRSSNPYRQELRYKHSKGHWITVMCTIKILEWDKQDMPLRVLGIHYDISSLRAKVVELKKNNQKLISSNDALEKFAHITSHDLKAPLRGIINICHFMKEDLEAFFNSNISGKKEVKDHLDRLGDQAKKMESLIRGILDYSKIDTMEFIIEEVNLNQLLEALYDEQFTVFGRKFEYQNNLPIIKTDKIRLGQVFSNLISNAFKYHDNIQEAKVEIKFQENEEEYLFCIKDNGPGIDEKFHKKIFDMFQTLQSKDSFSSTGVGLTLVKRIISRVGGRIWVESSMGEGCRFFFEWPKKIES